MPSLSINDASSPQILLLSLSLPYFEKGNHTLVFHFELEKRKKQKSERKTIDKRLAIVPLITNLFKKIFTAD